MNNPYLCDDLELLGKTMVKLAIQKVRKGEKLQALKIIAFYYKHLRDLLESGK